MNRFLISLLLIFSPVVIQFVIGNRAIFKFIEFPYWLTCLISFILLIIMSVASVFIVQRLEIIVWGIFSGIILLVIIIYLKTILILLILRRLFGMDYKHEARLDW